MKFGEVQTEAANEEGPTRPFILAEAAASEKGKVATMEMEEAPEQCRLVGATLPRVKKRASRESCWAEVRTVTKETMTGAREVSVWLVLDTRVEAENQVEPQLATTPTRPAGLVSVGPSAAMRMVTLVELLDGKFCGYKETGEDSWSKERGALLVETTPLPLVAQIRMAADPNREVFIFVEVLETQAVELEALRSCRAVSDSTREKLSTVAATIPVVGTFDTFQKRRAVASREKAALCVT